MDVYDYMKVQRLGCCSW